MAWQELNGTFVAGERITQVRKTGTTSVSVEVLVDAAVVASFGPYPGGDPRIAARIEAVITGDSPVVT